MVLRVYLQCEKQMKSREKQRSKEAWKIREAKKLGTRNPEQQIKTEEKKKQKLTLH